MESKVDIPTSLGALPFSGDARAQSYIGVYIRSGESLEYHGVFIAYGYAF